MLERGVDLLVFAGGDGTARDILDTIGAELPLVGVPTGVKMHSGVFAATPDAAGAAAAAYLRDPGPGALTEAEIADVDEDAAREDRVTTRLYGSALVPRQPALIVASKAPSGPSADGALDALCAQLARALPRERVTLLGPGTTTARVLRHLGLPATLLGIDAVQDGRLIAADLDEDGALALVQRADGEHRGAMLIGGVIGGQGSLFGRGNQQLSPRVLRALGPDRIQIVAAADKLLHLHPSRLRVDTGDDALDAQLSGYVRVHVAPGRTIVMKVST
jgi:predicted polyphosphate/ATP-dependent NAD kinase